MKSTMNFHYCPLLKKQERSVIGCKLKLSNADVRDLNYFITKCFISHLCTFTQKLRQRYHILSHSKILFHVSTSRFVVGYHFSSKICIPLTVSSAPVSMECSAVKWSIKVRTSYIRIYIHLLPLTCNPSTM